MRGYSLRSSYPLARSSQSRRRLMLLYQLNRDTEADTTPEEFEDYERPDVKTLDAEELRRLMAEQARQEPVTPFVEDVFAESERRNQELAAGTQSESVLDEEEDQVVPSKFDESILTSALGEDSLILSTGNDESGIFSLEDLGEAPVEELPGSHSEEDRKPHFPSWYVPNFKTVKRLLDGDSPITWVFAGECASSAADLAQGRRGFTDHFSERLRMEMGRMLDVVINAGDTGETCENLLKNLEWRVLRFHPEVISLMIGKKDAEQGTAGLQAFQNSLEQLTQAIRDAGSVLVLHTPNRVDNENNPKLVELRRYVRVVRDVAQSFNVPLIDHWEHWKQQKPRLESLRTWLAKDGAQPGVYGHREIAKLIFHRFEIFDPNSPICAARVP